MEVFERIAAVFGIMLLLAFVLSVKSCQCDHRAGNGVASHYNPIYGCEFSVKG